MARKPSTAAVLVLGAFCAACTADRVIAPEQESLSPDLHHALLASGASGPTAVATVHPPGGNPYTRVARPQGQGASLQSEAAAPAALALPDIDPRFLLFTTYPSGPSTFGAPNEVTVVWGFYCINGATGEATRVWDVDVVEISNTARAGTGGHGGAHPLAGKPVGAWTPAAGHTAADGTFETTYRSGPAAGDEAPTLTYTVRDEGSPCEGATQVARYYIGIRYPGLVPIQPVNGIYFDAITSDHNTVFYATPGARDATYRAALYYANLTATDSDPGVEALRVNAASTIYGGLNDVNHNWRPPHHTHRVGTDVDLDGKAGPAGDNPRVWQKVQLAARAAGFPRCDVHNGNHVHCYHRLY